MGQSQSQKANNGSEWESTKFAEGRFSWVIKDTWLGPRKREGQKCVEKHLESYNTWDTDDWAIAHALYGCI